MYCLNAVCELDITFCLVILYMHGIAHNFLGIFSNLDFVCIFLYWNDLMMTVH